jgi:hypothetical protein
MTSLIELEVLAVLAAWALVGYSIWKWGPGKRNRTVVCPEKKVKAKVRADQREGEFGSLRVADVTRCSLVEGEPLTCDKACVARL